MVPNGIPMYNVTLETRGGWKEGHDDKPFSTGFLFRNYPNFRWLTLGIGLDERLMALVDSEEVGRAR